MKYYKEGHRTMQMVDTDQMEVVEAAGWSRTKPEEAVLEKVEPKVEPKIEKKKVVEAKETTKLKVKPKITNKKITGKALKPKKIRKKN